MWDESSFKRLRKCNLDKVNDIVDSLPVSTTAESNGFPGLILVDDIMYLRSMRREVYVVAREKNIPIIVVWINTPLEVALQRNSQRVGMQHIDEETITKIHNSLEPPDSQRICDRNHVIIDGACEDRYNTILVAKEYNFTVSANNNRSFFSFTTFIQHKPWRSCNTFPSTHIVAE